MTASTELLDHFKKAKGHTSDNAAAKALGLGRATTSSWRTGVRHPNAETVAKICEQIGENTAKWLPLIEAERAATAADRKVWLRLASRAASIAAAAVLVGLTRMSIM